MHVQLRRHIAQGADVQLVDLGAQGPHRATGGQDFVGECGQVLAGQVLEFARGLAAGDQHNPRIAGVVVQPNMT